MAATTGRSVLCSLLGAVLLTGCSVTGLVDSFTGEDVNREVRARGLPAEAVVLEIWDTGTKVNDDPVVGFRLELHAAGRDPWQAETRALVSILDLPRVQPGATLSARYLEEDPQQVALGAGSEEAATPVTVQEGASPPLRERLAIERILAADDQLGDARNHDCEAMTIAEAIARYVAGLDALDFEGAPADFVWAFARHRDAWEDAIPFFATFPELRGEMHALFDQIRRSDDAARTELERLEEEIWETWSAVETAERK